VAIAFHCTMKRFAFVLLVAAVVSAELSEECKYVAENSVLTHIEKVRTCFESYTVDQVIVDYIIKNLELIEGFYPYYDIALNPPKEPAGYFKKMNFTSELEDLKTKLAESDGIVSKVFRPTMKLINGFRDAHFGLDILHVDNEYDNLFASVYVQLPFKWEVVVDGDKRGVRIHSPNQYFLEAETCEKIEELYKSGTFATTIDGMDAFAFFADFLGDYRTMKSPQGNLALVRQLTADGFALLKYPLENVFDEHWIAFADSTNLTYTYGFTNEDDSEVNSRRSTRKSNSFMHPTLEKEKEIIKMMKNFKPRPVRQEHVLLPCDSINGMNYIQIPSFYYEGFEAWQFIQELSECASFFETNKDPITIVLPFNWGGYGSLLVLTQFLLMPSTDFRIVEAIRKTEETNEIGPLIVLDHEATDDFDTCDPIVNPGELEDFWKKREIDDLGDGIMHVRTPKIVESYKDAMQPFLENRMKWHVRNPTDIIIATDGLCFSACACFVDDTLLSGGAIIAGYGVTNPGDDLFGAGQCPSDFIFPDDYFPSVSNNSYYGFQMLGTSVESFVISPTMNETIPTDYRILPIDEHTGYYGDYDYTNQTHLAELLELTSAIHGLYQTKCNPNNKRLRYVTDQCTSAKPHAVRAGFACGENGEWDETVCKIASCQEGYVVDFENDKCVPNGCDPRYHPESPSLSSSSQNSKSSASSSSAFVHPGVTLVLSLLAALCHFVF